MTEKEGTQFVDGAITETFIETFGGSDPAIEHNLRCEMIARAIKAIGDSTKEKGGCWRYPKTNATGYGITSVLHKTYVTSRLVLCCDTDKPYGYHDEESGEYMIASHRSPVICQHRDCLNPDHLYWETKSAGCARREVEERDRAFAKGLASSLLSIAPLSHDGAIT